MGLDIRIPLGLIFMITGGMMTVWGIVTRHSEIYARSLGVNMNLWWGLVMLIFGVIMFVVGRRQKWQDDPVGPRPWEHKGGRPQH